MGMHSVGGFLIEVIHQKDPIDAKTEIVVAVYKEKHIIEQATFDFKSFNSAELRNRLPAIATLPVRAFDDVIEDARKPPNLGPGRTNAAGKPKKGDVKAQATLRAPSEKHFRKGKRR